MTSADAPVRPLLAPGLTLALCAALVLLVGYVGARAVAVAERDYRAARAELAAVVESHEAASRDHDIYRRYADRFNDYTRRGWIGPAHRLAWVETVQALADELGLPHLRYELDAEQVGSPEQGAAPAGMVLARTPMALDVGALHEGDVLRLLAHLRARTPGLGAIERCRLERRQPSLDADAAEPDAAVVEARCVLFWYTLALDGEGGA